MASQHITCMLIKLRVLLNQKGRVRLRSLLDRGKGNMAMFNTIPGVGSVETMDIPFITVRRNKLMKIGLMSLLTMEVLQTFKSDPRIHTSDTITLVSDPITIVSGPKTIVSDPKTLLMLSLGIATQSGLASIMILVLINPARLSFAGYQKLNFSLCRMERLKKWFTDSGYSLC